MAVREDLVTVSEAKVRLHEIVRELPNRNVLLLRHGKPVAAVLGFANYLELLEEVEDLKDRLSVLAANEAHTTH